MGSRDDGHSRRDFLKGATVAATAAAVLDPTGQDGNAAASTAGKAHRKGLTTVALNVNGETKTVSVEPRTTLLDALRLELGLTGAKKGCDRGACGACTVLVDGEPQVSCMSLAIEAKGRKITTVEGVAADPANAALLKAFEIHDAAQCGYCIPGFVVSASALLSKTPKPSASQVRQGLCGNMCRCGTQSKIFDAVAAVAGRAAISTDAKNHVAIENVAARIDVQQKVTGAARYTADVTPNNCLYARFIRFPQGAGSVVSADIAKAQKVPGVLEVKLETKTGRYVGDRLGHIIAESEDAIEDALQALALKVRVDGVKAETDRRYSPPSAGPARLQRMYDSAAGVAEGTFSTQVQTHSPLEPHGLVVIPKDGGKQALVYASTQGVTSFRGEIAGHLGLSASKVEVRSEYVGGGFGAKFGPGAEGKLAASVAKRFKRPCKVMLTRWEEHVDAGNRPGSIQYMKIAADKSGSMLGGRVHKVGVVGFRGGGGGVKNPLLYDFGSVHTTRDEITLTAGRPRAFRAPGHPQGVFALESMVDALAAKVGVDPVVMRLRNEKSSARKAQLKDGAKRIGWKRRKADGTWPGRVKHGFGCAGTQWYKWPTQCSARVEVYRSGQVVVSSGVQDIGTGTFTVVADVAAEALRLDRSFIDARVGRSSYPAGPGSGGSQVARSLAPAVVDGCSKVAEAMRGVVAHAWGLKTRDVRYGKAMFRASGKKMTWKQACALLRDEPLAVVGKVKQMHLGKGHSDGVQFAEVAVDTETGVVRVIKIVAIQACGKVINRLNAENQICGGVIQGLSYALFEDRKLDRVTGGMVNANLEMYRIAGTMDVPDIIPVIWSDPGQTGVRALGEPTTIPTAGAIANAVANAIGARVYDLPMSPKRVLAALASKGKP